MPIQITCPGCQSKLRAPDTAAGKKTKCPKCQTIVSVPANAADATATVGTPTAAASAASATKDQWFLKTPDGSQYGPVPRGELDQWYAEGRISAECQLLREGRTQWQWAADEYPALAQMAGALAGGTGSSPGLQGGAGPTSTFSPLSPSNSPADPLGLSPLGTSSLSPLGTSPDSSTATLPSFTSGTAPTSSPFGSPYSASPNPYSSPAMGGSYAGYRPAVGHHPMVIVAGIFHILMGCWNAFNCFLGSIAALGLMVLGGAVGAAGAAAGADNPDPKVEGLTSAVAAFGVLGGVIALLIALLFLAYGILQIVTAVGLFMRRQWARTATFTFAGIGIAAMLLYVCLIIFLFDISSMIGLMGEIVYVPILLLSMLLPDSDRGFQ